MNENQKSSMKIEETADIKKMPEIVLGYKKQLQNAQDLHRKKKKMLPAST